MMATSLTPIHPPHPFTATGGARIGWTNATWPLAKLSASPDKLALSVGILGNYTFAPNEVTSVERYAWIPLLAWGVRIYHCKADCPQRVIFWHLGNPNNILQGIRESGFVPTASESAAPQRRGLAIRWSAIIIAILVWNGLFYLAGHHTGPNSTMPGPLILTPLAFAFALSLGTLKSTQLQRLILKPDRNIGEIKSFLRLLAFISGLLLIIFTISFATGAFNEPPHAP